MGLILAADVEDDDPVGAPLIGYDNLVTTGNITSTTEADGFPITNVANPATHLKWVGGANTGDEVITITTSISDEIDYLAVAKHNFGSDSVIASVEGVDPSHVLLHFERDGSSPDVIVDSNTLGSAHTWTAVGSATEDVTVFKFSGSSLKCDGSSDWVETPSSEDFLLGSSDFTIDLWFFCNAPASVGSNMYIVGQMAGGVPAVSSFYFYRTTFNNINFGWSDGSSFQEIPGVSVFTDAINVGWHHIAAVRSDDTIMVFIDGVMEVSTIFTGHIPNSLAALQVGTISTQPDSWLGWIDEFRLLVGHAMWTENFMVPDRPYGTFELVTASEDDSSILLHFDGIDGATSTHDSNTIGSDHVWTFSGSAQIDTATIKFGGGALLLGGGATDRISTPDRSEFILGSDDWTVDCWFNVAGGAGTFRRMCGQGDASLTTSTRTVMLGINTSNQMTMTAFVQFTTFTVTGTTAFTTTGWHHIAGVRTGNTLKMFVDGVQEGGNVAITGAVNDSANTFSVGQEGEVSGQSWNGWIDEFRLTVGTALWTSNFTVPSEASSSNLAVTNDDPIIFRWTQVPLSSVRLRLRPNTAAPEAAVIYVGKLLVMERSIDIGPKHVPITYGRRTSIVNGMSENANFLGRIVLGEYRESKAEFEWFTPEFYRSDIDTFLEIAQERPFFWVWSPSEYPAETGYVWLINNAEPEVDPVTRRVGLELQMRGIA